MAYVTGSAASLTAFRSAIIAACVAAGWANNGDVLSRSGCHVSLGVYSNGLRVQAAESSSGSSLVNPAPYYARVGEIPAYSHWVIAWPANYHIFINSNPDEVWCVIECGGQRFQHLAFGKSNMVLPGSGNWHFASLGQIDPSGGWLNTTTNGGANSYAYTLPFACWGYNLNQLSSLIHHGYGATGNGWGTGSIYGGANGYANAIYAVGELLGASPNAWNAESVLIPLTVNVYRESSQASVVAQIRHARYVRVDNFNDGQLLTIATDSWMVFPAFQKNTALRSPGTTAVTHTGTFGLAIRRTT